MLETQETGGPRARPPGAYVVGQSGGQLQTRHSGTGV